MLHVELERQPYLWGLLWEPPPQTAGLQQDKLHPTCLGHRRACPDYLQLQKAYVLQA